MEILSQTSTNLRTMEFYTNPSKKIRLDLSNNQGSNAGNDDLWGQDDITAEEFDMLEVQATQATTTTTTFLQPPQKSPTHQPEELKQLQYELEGKIKILSDSLETLKKEVKQEKLLKEQCLKDKAKEFQVKEASLNKEIKKLQSVLDFKNQEMKTVYEKIKGLETQLQEKVSTSELSCKNQSRFLEKCDFQANASSSSKLEKSVPLCRQYKLLVDIPQGKTTGSDIVSSLLCNRLVLSPNSNPYVSLLPSTQSGAEPDKTLVQLSSMSITKQDSEQQTIELLDYISSVLQNYLSQLSVLTKASSSVKSPVSIRHKELNSERNMVLSCLKDLNFIVSCPQFSSVIQSFKSNRESKKEMPGAEPKAVNNPMLVKCDNGCRTKLQALLKTLINLSKLDNYPIHFSKEVEIEWSLASIVSWSSNPVNLLCFLEEIPDAFLMNWINNVKHNNLSLRFILYMLSCKEFLSRLIHKNDTCIMCCIAKFLLQNVSSSPKEFTSNMLMIESIFSTILSVHSFNELNLQSMPCSSMILQGIITSLHKFYEDCDKSDFEVMLVMKRGLLLLHLLSRLLPNFKELRTSHEDFYISLISRMLTLSKENLNYKECYDLLHQLWDFQEDTNEFDPEESPENSPSNMDF